MRDESPNSDAELSRLRSENALLRAMLELSADVVAVIDVTGVIRQSFRSRDRPIGHEPAEMQGTHIGDLLHPDERTEVLAVLSEVLQAPGCEASRAVRLRRSDGDYIEMECTATNRCDDPDVGGVILHCYDASDRNRLEYRLQLAERMEAVGRLASGVAHDFNNILAIIQLSAARALQGSGSEKRSLGQILSATERASALTKKLLSFAREKPQPAIATNLCRLIDDMADTLQGVLVSGISLRIAVPSEPRYVMTSAAEVEQAVLNLVLNARDAIGTTGSVTVAVADGGLEAADHGAPPVLLSVADDGSGMDAATAQSIFEPFFTTKSAGGGTGLGLWTVRDFVSRSGGTINVRSIEGQGTTFEIALPRAQARGRRRSTVPPMRVLGAPGKTVLLAEDEPALRETVAELLRDGGHRVLTAIDGQQALSMVASLERPVDILVTDVLMPRLGGVELAVRLREQYPNLSVLFVTGYGETAGIAKRVPRSVLLRKPFAADALLGAIARLTA